MHCHILNGLDDGSQDLCTSRKMLSAAHDIGIDHIVATPHLRQSPYDFRTAYEHYDTLQAFAEKQCIRLDMGFEVHWNALLGFSEKTYRNLCFANTQTILIEFSLSAEALPDGHDRMIHRLQRCGLDVIIAHPERYRFVQNDCSLTDIWHDMGCLLQLDGICLLHSYEHKSKPTARKLFRAGVYDYIASDAHCPEDYAQYAKALKWAEKHGK